MPLENQEVMSYVEAAEDGELTAAFKRQPLPLEKHSTHLLGHHPFQSQSTGRPTLTEGLLGAELKRREMSLLIFLSASNFKGACESFFFLTQNSCSAAALRGLGIKGHLL